MQYMIMTDKITRVDNIDETTDWIFNIRMFANYNDCFRRMHLWERKEGLAYVVPLLYEDKYIITSRR